MNMLLEEDTQRGRYLTFALGSEAFGIEIAYVKEIVGIQPITVLPDVPRYVKGVVNLRGKIIPVVDMRLLIGRDEVPHDDRTCIIIIEVGDRLFGLIVDAVSEVATIEDGDIVPPPTIAEGIVCRSVKAIGKVGNDVKMLLDCERLFCASEWIAE